MGLKDLAQHMSGDKSEGTAPAVSRDEPTDAFDAPMMIMNQIHEA